jgi:hypothetical protein
VAGAVAMVAVATTENSAAGAVGVWKGVWGAHDKMS